MTAFSPIFDRRAASLTFGRWLIFVLALISAPAMAGGDPERGREISATCATCHGVNGDQSSTPDTPLLAGQHASYLLQALQQYRSGARKDLIMASFVKDLPEQDMEDIVAWYASQAPQLFTPEASDIYR